MGSSVQKENRQHIGFEHLRFNDPGQYQQQPQQLGQSSQLSRQDSRASFVETTLDRNKRNVINEYDLLPSQKRLKESQQMKEQGNKFYEQKEYAKAIDAYSAAIVRLRYQYIRTIQKLHDGESLYYSNRAIAYKHLGRMNKVVPDCEFALKLNPSNTRALSLYGSILVSESKFVPPVKLTEKDVQMTDNGIKYLEKAQNILNGVQEMSKAKLRQTNQINFQRSKRIYFLQQIELEQKGILGYQQKDVNNMLAVLASASERAKKPIQQEALQNAIGLNRKKDPIVPYYFVCVITQEIMKDPIMTEAGHTYEKEALTTQFKTNGCVDPNTRSSVEPSKVVYNMNLKMGIESFLKLYAWVGSDVEDAKSYQKINIE